MDVCELLQSQITSEFIGKPIFQLSTLDGNRFWQLPVPKRMTNHERRKEKKRLRLKAECELKKSAKCAMHKCAIATRVTVQIKCEEVVKEK